MRGGWQLLLGGPVGEGGAAVQVHLLGCMSCFINGWLSKACCCEHSTGGKDGKGAQGKVGQAS
jgi:hypothetical protein